MMKSSNVLFGGFCVVVTIASIVGVVAERYYINEGNTRAMQACSQICGTRGVESFEFEYSRPVCRCR